MGGQNNLPADTGRSDLRTRGGGGGVKEPAGGPGPGPRGGKGADEGGMRGNRIIQRLKSKSSFRWWQRWLQRGNSKNSASALLLPFPTQTDSTKPYTIKRRNWHQVWRVCADKVLILPLVFSTNRNHLSGSHLWSWDGRLHPHFGAATSRTTLVWFLTLDVYNTSNGLHVTDRWSCIQHPDVSEYSLAQIELCKVRLSWGIKQ